MNNELNNFLQQFRKTDHIRTMTDATPQVDVCFMIRFDEHHQAFVEVVDSEGRNVAPDYRLYTGETFNVLRTITRIHQEKVLDISWTIEDKRIYLSSYSYLLYELLRCKNLVDSKMSPIRVSEDTVQIQLLLNPTADEHIDASFMVLTEEGGTTDFQLISDVFVIAENTIYPIRTVGENYASLHLFAIRFPKTWLESYLSVFFSYVEHITPVYEDYQLTYSDQDIMTVPTLVIEKVDSDMALYLRLIATVPGQDFDFVQQFDLVYIATLTMEHQLLLQRIHTNPEAVSTERLLKLISSFATSKQDKKDIYQKDDLFIIPQNIAGQFLLSALPSLVREYRIVGTEKLKDYKVSPVRPKISVHLGSGINYLEGDATMTIDNEKMSLREFLVQYRKNKYIELSNGERAIVDENYVSRLERIFKQAEDDKYKVSFFDLPEMEDLMEQRLQGEEFRNVREVYEGFNKLGSQKLTCKQVNATLRDYQKEGVKWINYLYENHLGGCLADDMGLGKTLQTITMLSRLYPSDRKPSLLVMPKSLLFNWQDEIQKFAPQLTYYIYYGNDRDMQAAIKHHLVLTTYAVVRNDIAEFCKQPFDYIILDESQNIKNVGSQTTQAICLLQGEHRLALSGTPIENNLTELYSLFQFLNPTMFGSLEEFNQQYTYPIQRDNNKSAVESLRRKIFPFMLRRLKKDVLKELPERIEQVLYVEMSESQRQFYEQRRQFYYQEIQSSIATQGIEKTQFVMFQALNELRRIASVPESMTDSEVVSPKLDSLIDSITEAVSNGHKVVIFFNYIAGVELVGSRLDENNIDFTTMTGSTHDRRSVVERFQNDASCKVLLMTLKTGGVGLNLTVADTVYIFEPWWNKAAEEQAINRLHRMGQKHKVMSYAMITRGTIEEKIRVLQQKKSALVDALVSTDGTTSKHLSADDISFLIGS